MVSKIPLLTFTKKGIYCKEGDFYIDPWQPVNDAIITHGHADHASWGHRRYLAHEDSVPILKHRLGDLSIQGIPYDQPLIKNGVRVSLHPAGHVLGSAQIRVEYKGEIWVVSGDYKLQKDPIATDFEPVPCHTFITECTFGLPVYHWPESSQVIRDIESWWSNNQEKGKTSIITAYSLGKAQRILQEINPSIGPIYVHGAIHAMNEVFRGMGKLHSPAQYLDPEIPKSEVIGSLVIGTPSALNSSWVNRLKPFSTASASGWMMLRGSKRRRNVDRGFVISDHADWSGLNEAISSTKAENVICTHGYTDSFARWLREQGLNASTESTQFEGELLEGAQE